MADQSTRESGYGTDTDEMEKQFLADLEKAKALSMETAALEKFRQSNPQTVAMPKNESLARQRRATYSSSNTSSNKKLDQSTTKTEINIRPRPESIGKKYTVCGISNNALEPPSNNSETDMKSNRNRSALPSSDLISWEQSNLTKKEDDLDKLLEMKSTVNQLYQQTAQVGTVNNNGPTSLPYFATTVNDAALRTHLPSHQRNSVTSRTLYPASSLPLAGASNSVNQNSLDYSKMTAMPIPVLPSNSSTNNEYKPPVTLSSRSRFSPPTSKSHLSAPNNSTIGSSTTMSSNPPDLPRRTIFTSTSAANSAAIPNYIPNKTKLMQTTTSVSNITQPPLKMTSSTSSHSLTPTSSMAGHQVTHNMDHQKQEILDMYNLNFPNMVSPTHGIAGDILSSSFRHLDVIAAGMVKSQSWTGNINRTRPSSENCGKNQISENQHFDKEYKNATRNRGSVSAKTSPQHRECDKNNSQIHSENTSSYSRVHKSNSDYSIANVISPQTQPFQRLAKIKERHPNDPLIDLGNDDSTKSNSHPLTKVSILEAFDPLADGNEEESTIARDSDKVTTGHIRKTSIARDDYSDDESEPIYYASSTVSDSSFYETYDPFDYMSLSKSSSSTGPSRSKHAEIKEPSIRESINTRTPSKKHIRHPSIDSGAAAAKTIERRKKMKADYENVVKIKKAASLNSENKPSFEIHSSVDEKLKEPNNGSILSLFKEEKDIAADKETAAFTEMVCQIRKQWNSSDINSNSGIVVSSRIETSYPPGETVKLFVYLPAKFGKEKFVFTCDVSSSIEHIITNVVVDMIVDKQSQENRVSFDGEFFQYMLRVKDSCEYLRNDSLLKDYEYVHFCYKLDKDIEFVLEPTDNIHRPFQRTKDDDLNDCNVQVKDINTLDHCKKLSYDELKVLLDIFEKEAARMQKGCDHLASSSDTNVMSQLRPQKVLQSVKAICKYLGEIETIDIKEYCDKLSLQCLQFDKAKGNEEPSGKLRPEILNELGEHYATVVLKNDSSKILEEHAESIKLTLTDLKETVQKLIEIYIKTFRVNFSLYKASAFEDSIAKETIDIFETLVARVCVLHRLNPNWLSYDDFAVRMQIFHGTCPIAEPPLTPFYSKSESFYENVVFDSWLESQTLRICGLPREARLVFTLIGRRQQNIENENGNRKSGEMVNVMEELGSASLQLFNYELLLAQGTFLLPIWPPGAEKVGPAPDSGSHPSLDSCPLITIELPELESLVKFPENIPAQPPTTDATGSAYDFEALDYNTQQQLLDICGQDIMTFTELPAHEKEILWEKRYYLKNVPGALPKVLLSAHSWDFACLPGLYGLLEYYNKPDAMDILQLFLPCFPDIKVRQTAIDWLSIKVLDDDMVDFLPQLLEALKLETWTTSPLAKLLLSRSLASPRLAHSLYWLLTQSLPGSSPQNTTVDPTEVSSSVEVARYRRRLQMMMRALDFICGEALRNAFLKQQLLLQHLNLAAQEVKRVKDSNKSTVVFHHMEALSNHLFHAQTPIPLSLAFISCGIDVSASSYFSSNTFPLKIAFLSEPEKQSKVRHDFGTNVPRSVFDAIYKVGDDLRQDQLTIQMIRVMDKLWLKEGLDMKMITFKCVPTGDRQGIVEMVTDARTLKEIQVSGGRGVTGSFKDTPVADWLKKNNSTTLEFEKAKDNFTRSCAGYSIATYLLGICDRHNDNIMVKKSGHIFHIDFGKFLGDHQMIGNFKRDRSPFVLTPDMAYVINGCEKKPSEKFHDFVDLCCKGFNVVRKNGNLLLNLFALMASSGIPGVDHDAVKYVQRALLPDLSNSEAAATFARMIEESLSSWFTQWNFFFHNLAQMRFSGDGDEFGSKSGDLLSYVPHTYTMIDDGRIIEVQVYGIQKRYVPEKHYVFILKIQRESSNVPEYIFRTYKEFCELDSKLCNAHPQARSYSLPKGIQFGRKEISEVAERRKHDIKTFLDGLFGLPDSVAHCELVYTFFHPILRDQEEANIRQRKMKDEKNNARKSSAGKIQGELKLSIEYRKDALLVMVHHAKDLAMPDGSKEAPNSYVKVYLHPDKDKQTKRKTKVVRRNCNPTFMEMLEYRMPLDVVRCRTLQATLWDCDRFQENMFLGAVTIQLADYFPDSRRSYGRDNTAIGLDFPIPCHRIDEKTLKLSVWSRNRILEKSFLGSVSVPLRLIPSLDKDDHNNHNIEKNSAWKVECWYHLQNVHETSNEIIKKRKFL